MSDQNINNNTKVLEKKSECDINWGGLWTNKIYPLKEGNWVAWKTQITGILKLHKVYEFIEGNKPKPVDADELEKWERKDLVAMNMIQINVSDEQIIHVTEAKSAEEKWNNL